MIQPEFHRLAVFVLLNDDVGARFLVFQLNFVAHQLDRLALRWIGRVRRDNEKADLGSLLAADLLDHLVEAHVAHVGEFAGALRHRRDPVADFQTPIGLRGAAWHQALDLRVTILGPQHRADADERETHVDTEILQVRLAQVFRVRVVGLGEGVEEKFHLLLLVLLVNIAGEALVTAGDQFRPRLDRMFAQMFLEQFARDPPAPDGVGLAFIFRPGRFLAAQLDGRIVLEIGRLIEQLLDFRHPIVDPLEVKLEDFVGGLQISQEHIVIQRGGVLRGQHVDILLGEEEMAEIEQLQIGLEEFLGNLVVQGLVGVMAFLQEPANRGGDIPGVRFRMKRGGRQRDGQKEGGQGKKRAERMLHSEKEVLESRRMPAERKETTEAEDHL